MVRVYGCTGAFLARVVDGIELAFGAIFTCVVIIFCVRADEFLARRALCVCHEHNARRNQSNRKGYAYSRKSCGSVVMLYGRTVAAWSTGSHHGRSSGSGESFHFTRRILSARSGCVNLLNRTTFRVWLTDIIVLLNFSVRWRFLAEKAIFTGRTGGVRYCVARRPCPLAGLAHLVQLAHVLLRLGRVARGRILLAPPPGVAVQTLSIRCDCPRGLGPLTRRTNFVFFAHRGLVLSISNRCWAHRAKPSSITVNALCVG